MTEVFGVIAPLFLVIFGSAGLERWTGVGERWSGVLNDFALYVGFPALIFLALARTPLAFGEHAGLLLVNSLLLLAVFGLAFLAGVLFHLPPARRRTVFFCLGFGNVAYLGVPILVRVWGPAVLPAAGIIIAVYLFWMFTLGLAVVQHGHAEGALLRTTLTGLIRNPLLLAVFGGITLAAAGISLPPVVVTALDMLSASVTPLVLVLIGLFIGRARRGTMREWLPVLAFSLATLFLVPALLMLGLIAAGVPTALFATSIVQAAMPVAITPFALADQLGLDREFIARSIVLSTVLSPVSLPVWIWLVGMPG
jgi:predicted permease